MRNRSYDAGEDNEMSFHKGDRIVEIEDISEDYWQGETAEGLVGLVPWYVPIHLHADSIY